MSNPDPICPKCKATMKESFIIDHGHADHLRVATWTAGKPEKSFWRGLKVDDSQSVPLLTFRCTGCGYLESYARSAS